MSNQMESAQTVSPPTAPMVGAGAGSGSATSPDQGFDVHKRIAELENQIRGLQAVGDKREAKFTERLAPLEDYARRAGIAIDPRIVRDMQVDEFLASSQMPRQAAVSHGNGTPPAPPNTSEEDYLTPLKDLGMEANDPDVIRLMRNSKDVNAFKLGLFDLKRSKNQRLPASPAAAVPLYNATPTPQGQEALRQQYEAEIKTVRRGDTAAVANVKIKYRRLGLQLS
jgi:hypothetical protein